MWIFLILLAAPALGQVCGRQTPARTVPECVGAGGAPADCNRPDAVRLWTPRVRPYGTIPRAWDSTDRLAGKSIPGRDSGHELFSDVEVATVAGLPHLFAAYNAGLQVWDISDPARPRFGAGVDGWAGDFRTFPAPSEVLNYIADLAVAPVSDGALVALAGYAGAGVTLWRYDPARRRLASLYQEPRTDVEQVAVLEVIGGLWVLAASSGEPLRAYDAGAALRGAAVVVHDVGLRGMYVDAAGGLIAHGGGLGVPARLMTWSPATGTQVLWTGPMSTHGVAFSRIGDRLVLSLVEESRGLQRERLRVLDVGHCAGRASCEPEQLAEAELDAFPRTATANDFVTSSGEWLHYGFATGNLLGVDRDRLWHLPGLIAGHPLAEVSAGGGTYRDACAGGMVGYWGWSYGANAHGLNNYVPRRMAAQQTADGAIVYIAAATVLGRHQVRPPVSAGPPPPRPVGEIFADGFEAGNVGRWR